MSFDAAKIYSLLPAIYRIRDIETAERTQLLTPAELARLQLLRSQDARTAKEQAELDGLETKRQSGPLRSLLAVIAEQTAVLEQNLDQLYDDLFIETCSEWVVPYIGDLVGARGITSFPGASFTQRAIVANTLAYRRRKGTAAALEQLAQDVTDWPASVVEYFQLLATTQYLNHLRPENLSVTNIGDEAVMESINTPFDSVTRNVDVRRIASQRGKYNIPNIGIFLYRLRDYSISAPAYRFDDSRYLFDVLGKDIQLFNRSEKEDEISHLAEPLNVPQPLSRRVMARRLALYYGAESEQGDRSVLLEIDGQQIVPADPSLANPNPPQLKDLIAICDLSDLKDQNGNVVTDLNGKAVWAHAPKEKIAIDPQLGRIALPVKSPPEAPPDDVRVSYRYGFSADMGGGEYERAATFASAGTTVKVPDDHTKLQDALDEIQTSGGVVEVETNNQFLEIPAIAAGAGQGATIELRAANHQRPTMILPGDASGDLIVTGGPNSEVTLNGWLIAGGRLRVPALDADGNRNRLRRLSLVHCTLAPGHIAAFEIPDAVAIPAQPPAPRLVIEIPDVQVVIDSCIVGSVRAVRGAEVHIKDSIVDASAPDEIAFKGIAEDVGGSVRIENSTIVGKLCAETIEYASNTIFLAAADSWAAPVRAERLQQGCVRFSFVPEGAQVPRRHRCQPSTPADAARVRPRFTSLRYGDAGYGQLSTSCPPEITRGADDGSEMGAFHNLYQPRRIANLRAALDEYLRFGLEAGIFYAS